MKKIFIFSLFFIILVSSPNQKAKDIFSSNHRYYVYPKSGLNLRSQPSIGSKSIGLLSRGAEIKVLEKTNQAFSADGISSNWWKVEVKGKTGYLFAGYVSRYPPPKKACSSIVDYLAEFYGEFNNKNPNITNYKKTARPCEGDVEM
ncbi:MAG: SH3 domain-containing protein, partial [Leptospiraceae bacterium]|nr:SH3 domain-containing protein [Leptospiraceae bacterium]